MPEPGQCVEVVRIRPKEGSEPRLLELRDELVQSYRDASPAFVRASLLRLEDSDVWVDLWYWTDRAGAEAGLANPTPQFVEWGGLVDLLSLEWSEVIADHDC